MADGTGPTFLRKSAYAAHRGVSPGMVTHWIKGGRLVLDGKLVNVEASDALLAESLDQTRGGKGGKSERAAATVETRGRPPNPAAPSNTFTRHRAVRESFAAKDAELKYLERAGELVTRADYDRAVADSMAPITTALDSLAPRIARRVVGQSDVRKIEAMVEEEVAAMRIDLAKAHRVLLSEPDKVRQ